MKIIFKRTGHTLLNNGILGICLYLERAKERDYFDYVFEFKLSENQLEIEADNLIELLDDLYYHMGGEVYDTYTLKQQEGTDKLKDCNIYYNRERDKFIPFPKTNTYGLTHLLTNNAQGVTRHEDGWTNEKKLKESDSGDLQKFDAFFKKSKLKKLSKLYYQPYTKITRLPKFKKSYWEKGDNQCYLTGEAFKDLVDVTNISPFSLGSLNFNSHLFSGDQKVSWKARYMSMFAPVCAYYHYANKLRETIYIYLVSSNNLINLYGLLSKMELMNSIVERRSGEFVSNIKFSNEIKKDTYTEQFEIALALTYSIYKNVILKYGNLTKEQTPDDDLFGDLIAKLPPLAVESFRAKAFGSIMKPSSFENLNRLTPMLQFFYEWEKNGVEFGKLLGSFKLIKPSERNAKNKFRLERLPRNRIAKEILEGKSILPSMEDLLFRCYGCLCDKEPVGYKDYKQLFLFTKLYESKINSMEESLQSRAISLGRSIGGKIKRYDKKTSEKDNAKKGRSDLIRLRKARTLKQFLEELIRIDFKYGLTINEELASSISDKNYYTIKQFIIIGALNILNPVIHPFSKTEKPE